MNPSDQRVGAQASRLLRKWHSVGVCRLSDIPEGRNEVPGAATEPPA